MSQVYDPMVQAQVDQLSNRILAESQQPMSMYREAPVANPYYNMPGSREAYEQYGVPPVIVQNSPYATAAYRTQPNGGVAPLIGYPSVYPHVLNGVPQDYAAPYINGGSNFAMGGTYGYDPTAVSQLTNTLTNAIIGRFAGRPAAAATTSTGSTAQTTEQQQQTPSGTGRAATGGWDFGDPNQFAMMMPPPWGGGTPPMNPGVATVPITPEEMPASALPAPATAEVRGAMDPYSPENLGIDMQSRPGFWDWLQQNLQFAPPDYSSGFETVPADQYQARDNPVELSSAMAAPPAMTPQVQYSPVTRIYPEANATDPNGRSIYEATRDRIYDKYYPYLQQYENRQLTPWEAAQRAALIGQMELETAYTAFGNSAVSGAGQLGNILSSAPPATNATQTAPALMMPKFVPTPAGPVPVPF